MATIKLLDFSTDPPTETDAVAGTAAQIPDGSIVLYPMGTGDPVELATTILKSFTTIDVVGQLVATATYAVGTYAIQPTVFIAWVLDANAPAGPAIGDDRFGGINTVLNLGRPIRLVSRHVGWLIQCKLSGVIFQEGIYPIAGLNQFRIQIPPSVYDTVNEFSDIRVSPVINADGETLLSVFNTTNPITIAAADPVITIEFRMLMS